MATSLTAQNEAPATVVLAECGDVILVLKKGKETATKLLVSSAFLSRASSVFENMFDGRFAEGQALPSTNPREIPLPDDDPVRMTILCQIIHMQTTEVPRQLDIIQLADFAVLCDKYDCVDAVRPWSRVWALELLPKTDIQGYEKLLMVTCTLDLPDEFYKVTQNLVRYRTFSVDTGVAAHGTDFVPLVVFARLQKGQSLYQGQLVSALGFDRQVPSAHWTCTHAMRFHVAYLRALKDVGVWPTKALPLQEYRNRMARMVSLPNQTCDDWLCPGKSAHNIKMNILDDMDCTMNSIKGICLDCVRPGNAKNTNGQCRVEHPQAEY